MSGLAQCYPGINKVSQRLTGFKMPIYQTTRLFYDVFIVQACCSMICVPNSHLKELAYTLSQQAPTQKILECWVKKK